MDGWAFEGLCLTPPMEASALAVTTPLPLCPPPSLSLPTSRAALACCPLRPQKALLPLSAPMIHGADPPPSGPR